MSLRGDDEIDSLLAMMGSEQTTTNTFKSSTKPLTTGVNSQRRKEKKKTKKRKKKGDLKVGRDSARRKKSKFKNQDRKLYADTRLTQNCFKWPCSNCGQSLLYLGCGLLHDCKGYIYSGSEEDNGRYGSSKCQSCGESAAKHELCISSSWEEKLHDESVADSFSPSIISFANTIVASRNARCLISEYHVASKSNSKQKQNKTGPQMEAHELSKNGIMPPLNSTLASSTIISENLDSFVGSVLGSIRSMQAVAPKLNRGPNVSISESEIQLLQEKVSALISDVQGYKEAMNVVCSTNKTERNDAAIALVEKRLAAMASCDAIYYRCYYAAAVSCSSSGRLGENSNAAAMIPHPPTYFSCPGLAWDVHDAGVESLRAFLGETSNNNLEGLAAPIDDSTRKILLESWGLSGRLSSATTLPDVGNPLLTLWQSRFIETIRHVWATRYSAVKSPLALRGAFNSSSYSGRLHVRNHCQESLLKIHETEALSPAVAQWRDSVRDYPANFYAYAAPTNEALQAISNCLLSSKIGQIVEAGAGTGYWSALLLSRLNQSETSSEGLKNDDDPLVVPYDIAPPSSEMNDGSNDRTAFVNEYHGNIPTFVDVHKANTFSQAFSASSTSEMKALLLCYPPPGSDMAERALSAHIASGGHTVMHIGEWQGLTGDAAFEALLKQEFVCQEKGVIPLPSWSTDTTYLTVWKKKSGREGNHTQIAGTESCSPALGYCSVHQCSNLAKRRCRYARCLQYCSLECYGKHVPRRRAMLAVHMTCTQRASGDEVMNYEDDFHFIDLGTAIPSEQESIGVSDRTSKRRKKKKRR